MTLDNIIATHYAAAGLGDSVRATLHELEDQMSYNGFRCKRVRRMAYSHGYSKGTGDKQRQQKWNTSVRKYLNWRV